MTENIRTYLCDMPLTIRGYTVLKDDWYTIVINENLCPESRLRAYRHELGHILRGDFERQCSADLIEVYAHGEEG